MKNLFISLIIIMFAAPIVALADGLTDFNTKCAACHGGNAKTNARRERGRGRWQRISATSGISSL